MSDRASKTVQTCWISRRVTLSFFFFFSSRRRHTRLQGDWSSDVCSSDLEVVVVVPAAHPWHGKKQIMLEELRSEPLLIRERGSGTRAALEAALAEAGLDLAAFRIGGGMGSTQAIKQAVKARGRVSLVSKR